MKRLEIVIGIALLVSLTVVGLRFYQTQSLGALSILKANQGGTGIGSATAGDIGKVIKVLDDSPFTYELADDATGGAGGSSAFEIATSTPLAISNLTYLTKTTGRTTISGVATSSLTASSPLSLSQPISIIGASASAISLDTSGTWSGNSGTATALAADGANCSAGSAAGGVSTLGAAQDCTDYWTEAENTSAGYVASTRTLTVAGTANQITSSAGAQDLSANRTWTLSFPNQLIFPANASTTLKFSVLGAGTSTDLQGNTEVWGMLGVGRTATTTIRGDNATSTFANALTATGGNFSTYLTAVNAYFTNVFIGADTLAEYISDTAGAFFTGNTETGITVTYQDADNTVDVVCDTASGSVFGCLAAADWTTFNNKQDTITAGDNLTLTGTDIDLDASLVALTGIVSTGLLDFGGGVLEISNGASPTADDVGELAHDTTDNQLILDDFVIAKANVKIWSVTVASTSPAFISGGLLTVPTQTDGYTITRIQCHVTSGTSKVIAVEDASANSSEDITCATTNTTDDGTITNATYTASELSYIDFGATNGAVDYVTISVFGQWTRE